MTELHARPIARVGLAAFALFGALSLAAPSAFAGQLQTRDDAAILTPSDVATLRSEAAGWPFDVRVLTSIAMTDRATFDQYVHAQVTSPNLIVVGLDPVHRMTSVHFGVGTRIAASNYRAIEDTADASFRAANWRGGLEAIFTRSASLVGSGGYVAPAYPNYAPQYAPTYQPRYVPMTRAPVAEHHSVLPMLLGLAVVGGVLALVFSLVRRAARGISGGDGGATTYRTDGYGGPPAPGYGGGYNGGYQGGGYGPAAPRPGMSPLGAGLLGAGLGAAAGYMVGEHVGENEHEHGGYQGGGGYDPGPSYDPGPGYDPGGGGNYDAGGSTSGWDGGGGGGGGNDGGGGGGDW